MQRPDRRRLRVPRAALGAATVAVVLVADVPLNLGVTRAAGQQGEAVVASARARTLEPRLRQGGRPDSAAVLKEARGAQATFERLRFRHLPWVLRGGGGPCDEIIGRYCIRDDGDDDWTPPPEAGRVRVGRATLVDALARAAELVPGDGWIAGQRVRYLVEAGRSADAVAAADGCRAERWWCLAVSGYARHAALDFAGADSAFAAALPLMPEGERRDWTDLSMFLEGKDVGAYKKLSAAARDSVEAGFWWLTDPLWMLPGNDRRTEHFARLVADQLQDRTRTTEGSYWGADSREILLRMGPLIGYERMQPRPSDMGPPPVVGHFAPGGRDFLPRLGWASAPASVGAGKEGWSLKRQASRSKYAPAYARSFDSLDYQLAVFRRGDSAVVVAGYELRADSIPPDAPVHAALVLWRSGQALPVIAQRTDTGVTGVVSVTTADDTTVLSIEAMVDSTAASARRAARARYGIALGTGVGAARASASLALSDILVLSGADALPGSLPEAITRARGAARAMPNERVGLYWEVYGLPARADSLDVELGLVEDDRGWGRRAARKLKLRASAAAVHLRWREQVSAEGGILPRALAIEIPKLEPGYYTLHLAVSRAGVPGTDSARVTRRVWVGERKK
ncbi:MAG: hypothetical protein WKG32_03460 [Gemmatimonadaceae bacterium]